MNLFEMFSARVAACVMRLAEAGRLPSGLDLSRIVVEPPRDATHGDLATNAAMALAKSAGMNPRALAELIAAELRAERGVTSVEIAGPGFINLRLEPSLWLDVLRAALVKGVEFGRGEPDDSLRKVNVEYVSANPTGPMHVGHGRGAVFGDALANLLAFAGRDVTREYYINDAGAQVDVLARSAYLRYREALGEDIGAIPEGLYPGDYLKDVGSWLAEKFGNRLVTYGENSALRFCRLAALDKMLAAIMKDLNVIGIEYDVFFSEHSLISKTIEFFHVNDYKPTMILSGDIYSKNSMAEVNSLFYEMIIDKKSNKLKRELTDEEKDEVARAILVQVAALKDQPDDIRKVLDELRDRGLIYEGRLPPPKGQVDEEWEDREQTLFRSTEFGDDVDRPLMKSDGGYTYFASDIAYHKSKFDRGFHEMIDVWGADHGGYVKRMQAAVKAITGGQGSLDIKLIQLVKLMRNGEPVKMSKRSGDFITLREVIDEVGRDAVRFMMIFRKNDAALEFDLAKVVEQSKDNPVFYVQYAHARCASVERQAGEAFPDMALDDAALAGADLALLTDEAEVALVKLLAQYPRLIEQAAAAHEPHRVAFYAHEVASAFHSLWNRGKDLPHLRFINQSDRMSSLARLSLVRATRTVLASALAVAGVAAPDEMR